MLRAVGDRKRLQEANALEANEMLVCLERIMKDDFGVAEKISKKLDSFHEEMMMDRIKDSIWDATIILNAGGRRKDACKILSRIFIYCSEEQKNWIKNAYPEDWLEIPDTEYTVEECRRIAGKYETRKDWKNGFIWMMKAAQKGDAASQNDVGVYFALGRGRQRNNAEAFKWFEKAAKGGNAVAYGHLAHRYYDGTYPCKKDREKARECWITAYKINRTGGYDKKLDLYFPKWRSEKHPLLTFSEKDWRFEMSQKDNIDYIEFSVEVDDEGTTELFTLDTVTLIHMMAGQEKKAVVSDIQSVTTQAQARFIKRKKNWLISMKRN